MAKLIYVEPTKVCTMRTWLKLRLHMMGYGELSSYMLNKTLDAIASDYPNWKMNSRKTWAQWEAEVNSA